MWSTEYSQSTDLAPELLWQLLRDVNSWGEWNDGIETIELDGPVAVGATFRMKPPGEDEVTSTIAELEDNRLLTDVTELGEIVVRVAHRLSPQANGGTTVSYEVQVSGPDAEEIGGAVSADFPQVIAALVAAAGERA